MLPPGANQQLHIWVSRSELADRANDLLAGFSISVEQQDVLGEVPNSGRVRRDRLVRKIGRSKERHLGALVREGIAIEESIWERPRASAVFKAHIALSDNGERARRHLGGLPKAPRTSQSRPDSVLSFDATFCAPI